MEINETNKYNTKDIAKWIREQLKTKFKSFKFSVSIERYSGGSSITINVMQSPIKLFKDISEVSENEVLRLMNARNDTREEVLKFISYNLNEEHQQINQYYINDNKFLTDEGKSFFKQVLEIANKHNWDKGDVMTDYFDVNYYLYLNVGKYDKPCIYTYKKEME